VDLGCGRGEFLSLLQERGIAGFGVDASEEMRAACHARGLDVGDSDALAFLEASDRASLGGLFISHVIEHLPPPQVLRLVELAGTRIAPGGSIVVETLNPQCLFAYAPFYMDLTHVWPIHPLTLQYLLEANGFGEFATLYRQYLPDEMLQLPVLEGPASPLEARFNEAMSRLQLIIDLSFKNFIYGMGARKIDLQLQIKH